MNEHWIRARTNVKSTQCPESAVWAVSHESGGRPPFDTKDGRPHNKDSHFSRIPSHLSRLQPLCTRSMGENIIQQVQDIESEADEVLAEARENARDMERSTEEKISRFRENRESQFQRETEEMEEEVQEKTRHRIEQIQQKAEEAEKELDSLDDEAVDQAVDFIVSNLREEH